MAPVEKICPLMSALEHQVCVEDRCRFWVTQVREYADGRREDFSECVVVVSFLTQQRQLTEQVRTIATMDQARADAREEAKAMVSTLVQARLALR